MVHYRRCSMRQPDVVSHTVCFPKVVACVTRADANAHPTFLEYRSCLPIGAFDPLYLAAADECIHQLLPSNGEPRNELLSSNFTNWNLHFDNSSYNINYRIIFV